MKKQKIFKILSDQNLSTEQAIIAIENLHKNDPTALTAVDKEGVGALHLLFRTKNSSQVQYDRVEIAIKIIKLAPSVLEAQYDKGTFLHSAASNYEWGPIEKAIDALKDYPQLLQPLLSIKNSSGGTFLHSAARLYSWELIKKAIGALKDYPQLLQPLLSIKNSDGYTVLHVATFFCKLDEVNLLLANGASPSLSMFLLYVFSPRTTLGLKMSFVKNYAYSAFSSGWNALEDASKAISGDITEFYDGEYDKSPQNGRGR